MKLVERNGNLELTLEAAINPEVDWVIAKGHDEQLHVVVGTMPEGLQASAVEDTRTSFNFWARITF